MITRDPYFWLFLTAIAIVVMAAGSVTMWLLKGNGAYVTPLSGKYIVVGDCPNDVNAVEFGTICKDAVSGKLYYRGNLEQLP